MSDKQPEASHVLQCAKQAVLEYEKEIARVELLCDEMGEALRGSLQSLEYVHDKHPECTGGLKRYDDICKSRAAIAKWKGSK